jgi:hypothetical protein
MRNHKTTKKIYRANIIIREIRRKKETKKNATPKAERF